MKPGWFELQIDLGIACQHAGDADGAVAAFGEAVKLRPQDAEAYNDLGLALVQKGDAGEAISKFKTAAQLRPDDGTFRGNLAIGYMQRADFDAAITELQAAIQAGARQCFPALQPGSGVQAERSARQGRSRIPERHPLAARLGGCPLHAGCLFWQKGEFDQASHGTAERRFGISPTTPKLITLWARFSSSRENCRKPQRRCGRRFGLQPEFAGAHTTLAAVLRQLGDAQGAAEEAKAGAKIAAVHQQSASRNVLDELRKTVTECRRRGWRRSRNSARPSTPSQTIAAAHYQLGLALSRQGHKDEAKKEFQKAAELDPHLTAPQVEKVYTPEKSPVAAIANRYQIGHHRNSVCDLHVQ